MDNKNRVEGRSLTLCFKPESFPINNGLLLRCICFSEFRQNTVLLPEIIVIKGLVL